MTTDSGGRLFTDWRFIIGTVIAAVTAVGVVLGPLGPDLFGQAKSSDATLHLGNLTVLPSTYGGELQRLGIRPGGTQRATLRRHGFAVDATVAAHGYDGRTFRVQCTASNDGTNATSHDGHRVSIAENTEETQPCWLWRLGRAGAHYTITVSLLDNHGEVDQETRGVRG
jgi:hypothetical protein